MNYEVCCVPTALSVTRQDCRTTSYFVSCRIVVGGGGREGVDQRRVTEHLVGQAGPWDGFYTTHLQR